MIEKKNLKILATKYTIKLLNENEIPSRLKKNTGTNDKIDKEKYSKFINYRKNWINVFKDLYDFYFLFTSQATRFIKITPLKENIKESITEHSEFLKFQEYFIHQRNTNNYPPEKLGLLSILHTAFNKEIEKQLLPNKLKNPLAEDLRQKGIVTINGIEIKLWQHHSKQSINDQLNWNKLKDFKLLNEKSTGENGNILLTGVFQIPRTEVAEYAVKLNFNVKSSVSKFIDYIVIGTENVSPSKIAKAIDYNKKGADIKIITEDTFLTLIAENINL